MAQSSLSPFVLKIVLAASLGSLTYGYSSGIAGGISAQEDFVRYFNYTSSSHIADAFNGIFAGGGLLGVLIGGYISEKYGRRMAIQVGCLINFIGSALMTASVTLSMLYVARAIVGISIGMIVMLIPLFQTEISPAKSRGFLVSMHGVMILTGYSLAAWINVGLFYSSNGNSWRALFGLQMVWPTTLFFCMFSLPESPRWLIENGFNDQAKIVMGLLEPEITDDQFETMAFSISAENQNSSWKSIFTTKSFLRRLAIGLLVMIGGQATGTLAITNYSATIYSSLGFKNGEQLYIGAGYITSGIVWNQISALLADRVGRKTLMIIGFIGAGVVSMTLEIIFVALYANTSNKAGNSAAVAFMFLHIFFYGGTTDATTYVYVNEIWPTHIRSKGAALCTTGLFIGILAFTTGVTTAMNNIKWRFYLIFVCLSFVNVFLLYFFVPETKNRTLEEIGQLFGDTELIMEEQVINGIDLKMSETVANTAKKGPIIHTSAIQLT